MKKLACLITVIFTLGAAGAWAQGVPPGNPGPPRGDQPMRPEPPGGAGFNRAMEELFFPPDLVMRNQRAIGLQDAQQEAIRAELQKTAARFTDLQWQQSAQVEAFEALCKMQPVDEKTVVAQLDKLLSLESEIKRLHFVSLVRVKNLLTPEQQVQLRELDRQGRPRLDDQQRRPGANQGPAGMAAPAAPGR